MIDKTTPEYRQLLALQLLRPLECFDARRVRAPHAPVAVAVVHCPHRGARAMTVRGALATLLDLVTSGTDGAPLAGALEAIAADCGYTVDGARLPDGSWTRAPSLVELDTTARDTAAAALASLDVAPFDARWVECNGSGCGNLVAVEATDTPAGIPPAYCEDCAEPYYAVQVDDEPPYALASVTEAASSDYPHRHNALPDELPTHCRDCGSGPVRLVLPDLVCPAVGARYRCPCGAEYRISVQPSYACQH